MVTLFDYYDFICEHMDLNRRNIRVCSQRYRRKLYSMPHIRLNKGLCLELIGCGAVLGLWVLFLRRKLEFLWNHIARNLPSYLACRTRILFFRLCL